MVGAWNILRCVHFYRKHCAFLISFAMDFWVKSRIITINFETVVLLRKLTNDLLPLLFFKCAYFLFITILSRCFARMKSNFKISFIISRKFHSLNYCHANYVKLHLFPPKCKSLVAYHLKFTSEAHLCTEFTIIKLYIIIIDWWIIKGLAFCKWDVRISCSRMRA